MIPRMKFRTETNGGNYETAHETLTPTDLNKTIRALQGMIDSKKAVNVEGVRERIKDVHAQLNKNSIPHASHGTTFPR